MFLFFFGFQDEFVRIFSRERIMNADRRRPTRGLILPDGRVSRIDDRFLCRACDALRPAALFDRAASMRAAASERRTQSQLYLRPSGFARRSPSRPGTKGGCRNPSLYGHSVLVTGLAGSSNSDSDDDAQDPRIHHIASTVRRVSFFLFSLVHPLLTSSLMPILGRATAAGYADSMLYTSRCHDLTVTQPQSGCLDGQELPQRL